MFTPLMLHRRLDVRTLLTVLMLVLATAACSGGGEEEVVEATPAPTPTPSATATATPTPTPTPKPTSTPTPTPVPAAALTGVPLEDLGPDGAALPDTAVVAVKIDNDPDARPQVGLADADVVIVEPIEGLTRLVAIFHSEGEGEVGPIRSGRRVDPELFGAFAPIFTFSGAAGPNYPTIDAGFPDTLVHDRNQTGWRREGTRSAPHNLFITLEEIRSRFPDHPGPGDAPVFATDTTQPDGGLRIAGFTVDYGSFRTLSQWTWEEGTGWLRGQDGVPHRSGVPDRGGEATQIVADNVVVLSVPSTGSQAEPVTVTGEGPARIHRDGRVFVGTWSKPTAEDQYQLLDTAGDPLPLSPGSTWIEVHPTSGTYVPGLPDVRSGEVDEGEG